MDEELEKRFEGLLSVTNDIASLKEVEFSSVVLDVASPLDSWTFSTVSCS